MMRKVLLTVLLISTINAAYAVSDTTYVTENRRSGAFPIVNAGIIPTLYSSTSDFPGVIRAFRSFASDLEMVSGLKSDFRQDSKFSSKLIIIAGTVGRNPHIDELIKGKKIDVSSLNGKKETFIIQAISKPFKGVDQALVIAGSDKRGTIYGIYDLSQEIGVSPWFWWADVPVRKKSSLYVLPGSHTKGEPKVEYRGIFINDEQPALGGWVRENYGGFNSKFYEKVFELILRMKGNFLWPAMWGQSFYSDDPLSPKLADEYGVVIGTSHHEPLMRAHVEWKREGHGAWNYNTNPAELREFWKEGIRRMGNNESIVTLAMRGDGDEPMSEESNVKLLQTIVADQRKIIEEITGKPITSTPQVWALYKEVQEYYEKGMRVPDDVTLLLCDDNWGNIRKLPTGKEQNHPGGYGIYYHYDYVGGPRNYKWLNTNPIPRVWEQMNLAYHYGATKIWIVNVGDIKPMEFPIEFFLDMAWNPETWSQNDLEDYTVRWARREFGENHAVEIARLMSTYTKFNGRRKPELLGPDRFSPNLFSLVDYKEAERVVEEWNALARDAKNIYDKLPQEYKDAYYQLILYPVEACANLNEMYFAVRLNRLFAKQGRKSANTQAARARKLFERDAELAEYYNKRMSGGKWNHFMDQLRIGYVGWHDTFEKNTLPEMSDVNVTEAGTMGIAVEGSEHAWPNSKGELYLPPFHSFDKEKTRYIDVFNKGKKPISFKVSAPSYVKLSENAAPLDEDTRIILSIDWNAVPKGRTRVPITISSSLGESADVFVDVVNEAGPPAPGFHDLYGFISIEAEHFTRSNKSGDKHWVILPNHGRTLSAITTFPVTAKTDVANSPYVEYQVNFTKADTVVVHAYFSPTIDFTSGNGLEYAISIGEERPQVRNLHERNDLRAWEESVKDNAHRISSRHYVATPGRTVIRIYGLDPGLVLQKLVIDTGNLRPSYLGPPESIRITR